MKDVLRFKKLEEKQIHKVCVGVGREKKRKMEREEREKRKRNTGRKRECYEERKKLSGQICVSGGER